MTCPFLCETRVRTCAASPTRKFIATPPPSHGEELCATERHIQCHLFQEKGSARDGGATEPQCPHFQERLVQFCTAVPVPRYVPYSSPEVTLCGSESYRYCEAYLSMTGRPHGNGGGLAKTAVIEDLHYSPNHLWLDVGRTGLCHVGIDPLLGHFLGDVDHVTLLPPSGLGNPTVILKIHDVDWPLMFPKPLLVEAANARLRTNPSPVTQDPHGSGWLFRGWLPPGASVEDMCSNLLTGPRAKAWIHFELHRLCERLHSALTRDVDGLPVAADGGSLAPGLALELSREQLLGVLNDFFPSQCERVWER